MDITNASNLEWFKAHLTAKRDSRNDYLPTGFRDLDNHIDGLYKGHTVVIAGRPGKGKTTLMMNLINNLVDRERILVFSTEDTKERILEKIVSMRCGIPHKEIRTNLREKYEDLVNRLDSISLPNLYINDSSAPSVDLIVRGIDTVEPRVVFLDYFQNISLGDGGKYSSSAMMYGNAIKKLSEIARDRKITFVALSQVKRFTDGRKEDDRPSLSDLKETGKQEEAAHAVLFVWPTEPRSTFVNVAVDKNREAGSIGDFMLKGMWSTGVLYDG